LLPLALEDGQHHVIPPLIFEETAFVKEPLELLYFSETDIWKLESRGDSEYIRIRIAKLTYTPSKLDLK
jgi:hypothetical protein